MTDTLQLTVCLQGRKETIPTETSPRRDSTEFSNNASSQDDKKKKQGAKEDLQETIEEGKKYEDSDASKTQKDDVKGVGEEKYGDSDNQDDEHDVKGEDEEEEEYEDSDGGQTGEAEESEQSDEDGEQKAIHVDLSCMKSLYQFRNRPTLPYLLTEYGMEDKGVPVKKVSMYSQCD